MSRGALTGTRIRERRMLIGMRQADLARDVGISPSYLNLIEHNRRRIGGKLLVDLARKLDVEASALTEGAETALLEALREASGVATGSPAELSRTEEFAGRFPGWAQLLSDKSRRVDELERIVEMLTERMTHDPFLSASLHEILSTVTAISSSAAILSDTKDIDPEWQARFLRNLVDESQRLNDGAQALVDYLDDTDGEDSWYSSPREELETYLEKRGYHLPELEQGKLDPNTLIQNAPELSTRSAREMARAYFERYMQDAAKLPLERFAPMAQEALVDPGQLALQFGTDAATVFRRLACMPEDQMHQRIGLAICDGSGTLTFRKPVEGFRLPRFGAACPLWPLYQSLSRPMTPIKAELEQAGRPPERFTTFAICQPLFTQDFNGPQVLEASMLIVPAAQTPSSPPQPVGTSCRICPRGDCVARREPSILADGF
ncbi:helix-turn-helix domain-containing protein [Actibacterium atlanticum]|uniref:helix-turn-helix domain-containing protein n=1 Tax=Actibacterium atlanticum TaxID=1461693 RepID=UPI0005567D30|nr:helix-turn-helix transcriptional regulator [Actibacterium atlanticum]